VPPRKKDIYQQNESFLCHVLRRTFLFVSLGAFAAQGEEADACHSASPSSAFIT
jgi:hypothetical protein